MAPEGDRVDNENDLEYQDSENIVQSLLRIKDLTTQNYDRQMNCS